MALRTWGIPEEWDRAQAEAYAAHYASMHGEVLVQQKQDKDLSEAIRRWLDLNDENELVDGETGLGVELGTPASNTTWDVRSMPDALVLSLARRGLLTVSTTAFDALRKASSGPDIDEAHAKYRMTGQNAAPLKVKVKA